VSPAVEWDAILLRLALSLAAGSAIGVNRSLGGKPAGLRTTALVCLAAALAMVLADQLMATRGKASDSFVVLDPMRLPLGVLTGMGFIGAGAILRRADLVIGVTTAAALWLATVVGLCLGAGQIGLGLLATALALGVLWGFNYIEDRMRQQRRAELVLVAEATAELELCARLRAAGYAVARRGLCIEDDGRLRQAQFELRWLGRAGDIEPPDFLANWSREHAVASIRWTSAGG
jgi:putative Mg2+ transporter-C (MgtC) family protein